MSSIVPPDAAALLILQQAHLSPLSAGRKPAADPVLAAASGATAPAAARDGDNSLVARARITEALFSVNSLDPTKMKANLFERLGKELGLSIDDFETVSAFGEAVRRAVDAMRREPEGGRAIAAIETKLGLGKLGLSVDTLIEAMIEPGGDADEAVEAALLKAVKETDEKALAGARPPLIDDAGLYYRP